MHFFKIHLTFAFIKAEHPCWRLQENFYCRTLVSLNRECSPIISNIFNVTSQKKKKRKKFFVYGQTPASIEISQFLFSVGRTDRWLVTVVTRSRDMKDLFSSKTRACVCVCVCHVLCGFLLRWKSVRCICVRSARGSSVQSQQRLGVLDFPLVFVFQCAGFHHRLGPENKKTRMLAKAAAGALTFLESLCFISWVFFLLLSIFTFVAFYFFSVERIRNLRSIPLNMNRDVTHCMTQTLPKYLALSCYS